MNKRLWVVFAIIVIAAVGGLIWWQKSNDTSVDVSYFADNNFHKQEVINSDTLAAAYKAENPEATDEDAVNYANGQSPDHTIGNPDAKVTVVRYEDFACPVCYGNAPGFDQTVEKYKEDVLFVYRNFSIGANTSTLSESGAEAAFKLGGEEAFWSLHDALFDQNNGQVCIENNDPTKCKEAMIGWAENAGLDTAQYEELLNNAATNGVQEKLTRDRSMGISAGVTGTPTWFVNGKQISPSDGSADSEIADALRAAGVEV